MSKSYHLPKIVKIELENLLKFCESKSHDSLVYLEESISQTLEALKESNEDGYVEFKN